MSTKTKERYRQHIEGLPPGQRIDNDDMDDWARRNCGFSRWEIVGGRLVKVDDYWGGIRVECMRTCKTLMREGWLVRVDPATSRFPLDDYIRTTKAA